MGLISTADSIVNALALVQQSGNPALIASRWQLFVKSDGLYLEDESGAVVKLSASGGSAPADATYITQTPSSGLSAEQALSALATGLMQVTTATGVISSVTTSAGLAALLSDETGTGALVFGTSPTISKTLTLSGSVDPTVTMFPVTAYALATATVTNKALTTNVATLTTSGAHGLVTGQSVVVRGVDSTFNGTFVVTGTPSGTTFTYAKTAADVVSVASGGTAQVLQTVLTLISSDGTTVYSQNSLGHIGIGAAANATQTINFGETVSDNGGTSYFALNSGLTYILTATSSTNPLSIGGQFVALLNQNGFNASAVSPGALRGVVGVAQITGASGTVSIITGGEFFTRNSGAGILTTGIGVTIFGALNSGGGTFTNNVALGIDAQTVGTNNVYLLLGTLTPPTGNWGIYSTSANNNSIAGNLGIGLAAAVAPTNPLSLSGQAARTIWMERHTTAATAGNALTVQAGGAVSGGTDKAGGAAILTPGLGTGNSVPGLVQLKGDAAVAGTGSGDHSQIIRFTPNAYKVLTNNSAIGILNLTNAASGTIGAVIRYTIEVTDGTDYQVETGAVYISGYNKGGSFAVTATETSSQQNTSSGTLATTWTITSANPSVLTINANSSLTPSTGFPRITFAVENLSQQAVAVA